MNALAPLPALPLDGTASTPPEPTVAVEGETPFGEQYRRLFGTIPPAEAIGIPLPARCDPTRVAECHLSEALLDVGLLRGKHFAKGHTLDADAQRGQSWFWHGVHEFWWKASDARSPEKRRQHKIAAAALLIASIEADDFLSQQQEQPS